MAKLRINMGTVEIIISKFIFVIIDGVEYKKSDYTTSLELQHLYMFIKKHKDNISKICYKVHNSDDHVNYMYLENSKFHNLDGRAYYSMLNDNYYGYGYYYIKGERLTEEEWKKKMRQAKLKKLINIT